MAKDRKIDNKAIIDTHVHLFNAHQVGWEVIVTYVENCLKQITEFFSGRLDQMEVMYQIPEENIFEILDRISKFTQSLFSTSHCILQTIENFYKRKKKSEKRQKKGVCVFIPLMMDPEYGIGFKDADPQQLAVRDAKIESIKRLDEQIRMKMRKMTYQMNNETAFNKMQEYELCMKKLYREYESPGISVNETSLTGDSLMDNTDHIVGELEKITHILKDKNLDFKEKIVKIEGVIDSLEKIIQITLSIELLKDITGVFSRLLRDRETPHKIVLLNRLEEYRHDIDRMISHLQNNDNIVNTSPELERLLKSVKNQMSEILPALVPASDVNIPGQKISEFVNENLKVLEDVKKSGNIFLNDATINTVVKYEHHFGQLKQRVNTLKKKRNRKEEVLNKAQENLFEELVSYITIMQGKNTHTLAMESTGLDMDSLYFQRIAMKKIKEKEGMAVFPFVAIDPRRKYFLDPDTRNKIPLANYVHNNVGRDKEFHGVKIYPTLWYLPSHPRLMEIYRICTEKKIPVTTHGGIDGFVFPPIKGEIHFYGYFHKELFEYHGLKITPVKTVMAKTKINGKRVQFYFLDAKVKYRDPRSWSKYDKLNICDIANLFNDSLNWIPVFENFKGPDDYNDGETNQEKSLSMHINMAHFGGREEIARYLSEIDPDFQVDLYGKNRIKPPFNWTQTTLELINAFSGVYTDFAFVDRRELSQNIHKIINREGNEKLKERLMFGSDLWLMGYVKDPAIFLEEYRRGIIKNCSRKVWRRITNTNPRRFLFPSYD